MSSSLHLLVPGWLDVLLLQQPCRATIVSYCLSAPGGPAAVAAFSGPSPCMGRREPRGRTRQSAPYDVGTPVYTPHSEYTRRATVPSQRANPAPSSPRGPECREWTGCWRPSIRRRASRTTRDASRPRDCDSGVGTHRTCSDFACVLHARHVYFLASDGVVHFGVCA